MIQVSPSSIGYLRECPRCLWLYFRQGIQRPRGIFPSLPSGMDDVLKHYFDHYRAQGSLPPELNGKVNARLYPDIEKLRQMRNYRVGLAADFPGLGMRLKGAIDELLVNPSGEHVILDFKTRGYKVKDDTHEHYRDQLHLYTLLLKENEMPPADYGYLLFLHPTGFARGQATFATEVMRLPTSWQTGMAILEEVREILRQPIPKAHGDCEYCLYRAAGDQLFD